MSEPVVKQRPSIDLDDFERRLRQPRVGDQAREDDPLAELARLVGEPYDPFNEVFAREAASGPSRTQTGDRHHDGRREPGFADLNNYAAGLPDGRHPAPGSSQRLFGDFAAIEAGLRGGVHPDGGQSTGQFAPPDQAGYGEPEHGYGEGGYEENWTEQGGHAAPHDARPASRRPMFIMATTIAVGVIGIGAAFALKGHVSSSPREIKTIMAEAGPTKIQPPPDVVDPNGPDTSSSGRGGQAPNSLVNREEQPVDITQAVQDNTARFARMGAGVAPTRVTDASTVPVPPSPRQVQTAMADPKGTAGARDDALGAQIQGFGLSDMPAPKRVKVVSVRPDGTILPNDQPPAAAIPAPRPAPSKTSDRAGPVAKASTPKVAAVKSTSRVGTTPKSIEQLATDEAPAEAKPIKKPKPQRVATADTGETEATEAAAPTPLSSGGGGFAVQLAAPGTEAEAKAASSKLSKKYAGALGGAQLGFHKAESNGKSVYRVRVGSLSRTDAVGLCEKLKADGGTCFVAKN